MGELDVYYEADGNEVLEHELEDRFEQMLDEVFGTVNIAGYDYDTSSALKEIDPTAYRCDFAYWLDSELGESIFETDPTLEQEGESDAEAQSPFELVVALIFDPEVRAALDEVLKSAI